MLNEVKSHYHGDNHVSRDAPSSVMIGQYLIQLH